MSLLSLLLVYLHLSLSQEQWRIVQLDGEVRAAEGVPRLTEAEWKKVRAAWVWSELHAPRRVEPAVLGRSRSQTADPRLAVRVVRHTTTKPPGDLRLIAAPREMWTSVPEGVLPSWPVPPGGRLSIPVDPGRSWRLRVAGRGEGSWWVDVPARQQTAVLTSVPAEGFEVTVLDAQGGLVRPVLGFLQEPAARQGSIQSLAFLHGAQGKLEVAGLPEHREISLTLLPPSAAPLVLRGRARSLPRQVRLPPGAELVGRITDARGAPLAGVPVEAEAFASPELPQLHSVKTESDDQGRWRLQGLPQGQVALTLRARGFVPRQETLQVEPGTKDLGTWKLEPGLELAVRVVDEIGMSIPGAHVTAAGGRIAATADGRGLARLSGLPAAPGELAGRAERHLAGKARATPPFSEPALLILPRALTVTGRLTSAGVAVNRGSVRVEAGTCRTESHLDDGGRFELAIPPQEPGELVLRSPETPELRLRLTAGAPGEVRDLGDLEAPASLAVVGRVVRAEDGRPVAGASLWVPRQGPDGPVVAWATRDLLETSSGEDGRFRLSGLLPVPALLRIEAPGTSRAQIPLPLGDPGQEGEIDLGTLELSAGAVLRVRVDPRAVGPEGAVARADLGNRWLDPDLLTAAVEEGEALLPHVPAGTVTVSVLAGRRLLCEQRVNVPEGGELAVDCRRPSLLVTGRVLVGGRPAAGGSLTWQIPNLDVPGRIDTVVSPAGLRQQQVVGLGRPPVHVAVGADGGFETEELVPGRWQVTFSAEPGSTGGALAVEIPTGDRFETVLPFAGLSVVGTVLDENGNPVEGARVRELTGQALAFSLADGSFTLTGIKPGKALVQAQLRETTSAVEELELRDDALPEPLRLVLGERSLPTVSVRVADLSGAPLPGAFVFLEEEGKGQRLLISAADGRATVTLEAPLPSRLRAAGYAGGRWGLGSWTALEDAREGLPVRLSGAFSLRVESERTASPRVVSEKGWDLSWLLRLLGSPPVLSPEQPLLITGLPAGRYTVSEGRASVTVPVTERGGAGRLE